MIAINPKYMESQKRMSTLSLAITEICSDSNCSDSEIASVLVACLTKYIQRPLPCMVKGDK